MKNQKTKKSFLILNLLTVFFLLFAFEVKADSTSSKEAEIEKCRELYNQKTEKAWEQAYGSTCSELARNGNGEAQYYVGMIIKNSPKIPDYKAMAYSFFYVANENGEKRAKSEMKNMKMTRIEMERVYNSISNIYNSSITTSNMIKKNDKISFGFLEKSASIGNKIAQSGLASSFTLGMLETYKFNQNLIQAYKWSYISVQDNIGFFPDSIKDIKAEKQTAQKVFQKVKSMCTQSQILQGQKLAEEWIKNNPDLVNNKN